MRLNIAEAADVNTDLSGSGLSVVPQLPATGTKSVYLWILSDEAKVENYIQGFLGHFC